MKTIRIVKISSNYKPPIPYRRMRKYATEYICVSYIEKYLPPPPIEPTHLEIIEEWQDLKIFISSHTIISKK